MAVGLDDVENVELPEDTIARLERERVVYLSSEEKLKIYNDFYAGKKDKKTNTTAPTTSGNNNVTTLTTPTPTPTPNHTLITP
jgi:hypothetical protein